MTTPVDLWGWAAALVHAAYWEHDHNCARTTLIALCEQAGINLPAVLWDAAAGMHGAGGYGAQCGLVEGMLLFLGWQGKHLGLPEDEVVQLCRAYAAGFEARFGSLRCAVLRPQGFPPELAGQHLCEGLTVEAVLFDLAFLQEACLLPR
ncbi:MAG: C_GCAxxG_C_C family protein [Anaerolineae bacterium]|nr:C_GCAxxG_C_C family protein [Anaerolineae bacterium]